MPTPAAAEARRLARLRALAVMDTPPEALFDQLTQLAAQICGTPVALLGLIDHERQWFKAAVGFGRPSTPRALTFCNHTLAADGLVEVNDTRLDPRFARHPDVLADPPLCFYAGVPLRLDDGSLPGTLCVVDFQPRQLSDAQREALTRLADTAAEALMLRERSLNRAAAEAQALAAKRDSEERFRVLAESAPLGIYEADEHGQSQYTNPAWHRIFGRSLGQSMGEGWVGALHPEDRHAVFERWRHTTQTLEMFEMEFRILRPRPQGEPELRHAWSRARPLLGDRGQVTGFVGVVEDITERIHAERQLRESEALLDRTGRVAGVGGWTLDLRTQQVVWSAQTSRIHDRPPGYSPPLDEAIGYYAPEARAAVEAVLAEGMASGKPWSIELPLVTATGRHIWVRSQGQVDVENGVAVRLMGTFQDVTEQHAARVELEHSRQRLRALYEATPALMYSVDVDGRVLSVSDRWLHRLGYPREQVVGRMLEEFMTPESAALVRLVHRPQMWREGHVDERSVQLVCADGSLRDVLVSAVTEYDPDGRPLRALALVDDITEDLQRQAELAREQQLRRQIERHAQELDQLLHERSEMLDVLAHEVRQPLNNASAALQSATASLHGRGESAALDRLTRAQAVLGQVLAGVDNTLAAATLLAGAGSEREVGGQDTDIDTLIAVTIADLPREGRERVLVKRHTATRTALMDMSLMRLALRNLLSNALKYAPPASPVTLHVIDSDEPLALIFEVADAGPGIPRELLPRLFSRGARGAATTEPTHGLGLYIVRRVMSLHGGNAELLRTGPLGTVMRLTLPQAG